MMKRRYTLTALAMSVLGGAAGFCLCAADGGGVQRTNHHASYACHGGASSHLGGNSNH